MKLCHLRKYHQYYPNTLSQSRYSCLMNKSFLTIMMELVTVALLTEKAAITHSIPPRFFFSNKRTKISHLITCKHLLHRRFVCTALDVFTLSILSRVSCLPCAQDEISSLFVYKRTTNHSVRKVTSQTGLATTGGVWV